MSAADIRAQLEQLAATGTATTAEWDRLAQVWQTIKQQTPQSYHAVIEDRLKALKLSQSGPQLPTNSPPLSRPNHHKPTGLSKLCHENSAPTMAPGR